MRTLGFLLTTALAVLPQTVADQKAVVPEGTIITSAQVTGFDIHRLSPGLRHEIRNLSGTPLSQQRLTEIAARLEAERPAYVAAVRSVMDADGQARVFFVMGRQDQQGRDRNINEERYIVEEAYVTGVPDDKLSQALRDELRAVVGRRLEPGEADRLQERLERELPEYELARRIMRGSEEGRIRLVYEAHKREPPPWLRFAPLRSNVVFNSEQGWGSYLDLNIGDRAIRFTPIAAFDSAEDLVEEYSGYGLRFEALKLGTRRLGASVEWTRFEPDWESTTLDALALRPDIPAPYDTRSTFTSVLRFAVSPNVSLSAGVSISELEPLAPAIDSRMANAAVASIEYYRQWDEAFDATHRVDASFGVRGGARGLESDLTYTRYLGQGSYRYDVGRHHVQATGMAGGITGQPPLFERFTLGDSNTLRGWNKNDISPAGGDRMIYGSIEYRYTGLALFLDIGSVWDENSKRQIHVSTGFGFHGGPAFLTVGFPLNTDNLTAILTMGLRIPGVGIRW